METGMSSMCRPTTHSSAPSPCSPHDERRIPYVVTFHAGGHSSRLRHRLRPLQLSLVRPLLARADRLIALAPFEIEHYATRLRVPPDRFALISNGSDLPRPPSLDAERSKRLADRITGSTGTLQGTSKGDRGDASHLAAAASRTAVGRGTRSIRTGAQEPHGGTRPV